MVAIIRNAPPPPTARNEAPYRPLVIPNMVVRVKPIPEAKKPKKLSLGPFIIQQTHYVGWDRSKYHSPIELIAQVVCEVWNITRVDLMSQRRHKRLSYPRQAAYLLAKEFTEKSFPEIGRFFKRDHTTVLHGVREAGKRMDGEFVSALNRARGMMKDALK